MTPVRVTAAVLGAVLLAVGVAGFVAPAVAGTPDHGPIFVTGTIHDLVHIITGSLALWIAFGLIGREAAIGLIGFGALFVCLIIVSLNSADLYGVLQAPMNNADELLFGAVAAISLVVGGWTLVRGPRAVAGS
jgi:Domain of unknown function (DUF4383)